jgi:tetratricopeptide (TPR) repeat protein
MALRPEDRYATARALAEDVERWTADEPVAAYREPRSARARRWARRHRPLVASGIVGIGLTLIGLTLGVVLLNLAYRRESKIARDLAEAKKVVDRRNAELVAANAATKKAEQLADARLDRAMATIQDYYTGVNEEVLRVGNLPSTFRDRLLAKPLEFYQQLTKELAARPDPTPREQDLLAEGRMELGRLLLTLGRIDEGRREYEAALAACETLAARHPDDPRYQKGPITARSNLVTALMILGRWSEGAEAAREAIATSKALVARHPDNLEYRGELARSQMNLGTVLSINGRSAEAVGALREAATNFEAVVALKPDSAMYQAALSSTRSNLARVLGKLGRAQEAAREYRKAIAMREAEVARHPELTDSENMLAALHNEVGNALAATGRPAEALVEYRKAAAMSTSLVARQPQVPNYKMPLAMSHMSLGNALANTDPAAAAEAYRVAIQAYSNLKARTPDSHGVRVGLVDGYSALGAISEDPARAAECFEKAVDAFEAELARTPKVEPYREALAESRLGVALAYVGKGPASAQAHRKAIAIRREIADRHPFGSAYRSRLGQAVGASARSLATLGDHGQATKGHREAIDILRPLLGPFFRDPETVRLLGEQYHGLAGSLRALGRLAEAAEAAREQARLSPRDPVPLYNAACELSLCVPIESDPGRKAALADEAMRLLRAAVAAGWSDGAHTARDPDLDPLRDRDDFRRLLADLLDRRFPADPFAR